MIKKPEGDPPAFLRNMQTGAERKPPWRHTGPDIPRQRGAGSCVPAQGLVGILFQKLKTHPLRIPKIARIPGPSTAIRVAFFHDALLTRLYLRAIIFLFFGTWSVGSVGRALCSHRRGHWFESNTDHHSTTLILIRG